MRRWLAALVVTACLAGCAEAPRDHESSVLATPCEPAGAATFGTLRVHARAPTWSTEATPVGHCVGLYADGVLHATARFDAAGNATLNLPVQGTVDLEWKAPVPGDASCAVFGFARLRVPGPSNVMLGVGGECE